tara:strand:- start:1757 stop:2998 length:1242 start_codon:yes stop_codon:yes gene_type:complete
MTISYKDKALHFDDQNILDIVTKLQTPFYIYSENVIKNNFNMYHESFGNTEHTICYSVKANSNLSILSLLAGLGSGFDIVSAGELSRVIRAGGDPQKTVFSGVGKTQEEIRYALDTNILCFNVESEDELHTINEIAIDMNTKANISVRVNPAISVDTHPYITTGMKDNKFGIEQSQILPMYKKAYKLAGINIIGIDFHIGSQIMDINPYIESLNKILEIIDQLDSQGIMLRHIDIGGGLGISYQNESTVSKDTFVTEIINAIGERNLSIIVEPGRSIVGESGLLVSQVTNIKKTPFKNFAVVDAGMNDLLRPPLYEAYHSIREVFLKSMEKSLYDVVGPICETADFLGKSRNLSIEKGDFLVVENVGAYGYSLSSNYNTRPKIDEYIISNSNINKIRDRETIEQILENELKYL